MKKLNPASDLRTKMEVWKKQASAVKDTAGQYPIVDTKVAEVMGCVIPMTGSLLSGRAGETALARTTHKIVVRYRSDITPSMWLKIGTTRFDILYIMDPYQRHVTLELFCEVVL